METFLLISKWTVYSSSKKGWELSIHLFTFRQYCQSLQIKAVNISPQKVLIILWKNCQSTTYNIRFTDSADTLNHCAVTQRKNRICYSHQVTVLLSEMSTASQGCHGIDEIVVSVNLSCHVTTTIPNSSTADTAKFGNSISIIVKPNIEQSRNPTVPNITQYILAKSNNTDPIHS